MAQFALIRSFADLARACDDLSGFFAARRQQNPPLLPEVLLGMWLEPQLAALPPSVLNVPDNSGARRPVRILESVGLSEIWALCWLDIPSNRELCRLALLEALLDASDSSQNEEAQQWHFIPVFPDDIPESDVQAEYHRLSRRHSEVLLAPIYQERHSGRIIVPEKHKTGRGAGR